MNISILGCGWLGLPLAKNLLSKSHFVKGSTTSSNKLPLLASEGIQPYLISVSSEGISDGITEFLAKAEILVIDIPPGLRKNPNIDFAEGVRKLIKIIEPSGVEKVLLVSSTSVYEDTAEIPTYTEAEEPNGTSKAAEQLITVEKMLLENTFFSTCIVRFGGLIGPDRHPVKYLAGRKNISNPMAPVNLIHQRDCIELITAILEKGEFGSVFNGVFSEHPSKQDYYSKASAERNLPPPEFDFNAPSEGKIVESSRVVKELGLRFQNRI